MRWGRCESSPLSFLNTFFSFCSFALCNFIADTVVLCGFIASTFAFCSFIAGTVALCGFIANTVPFSQTNNLTKKREALASLEKSHYRQSQLGIALIVNTVNNYFDRSFQPHMTYIIGLIHRRQSIQQFFLVYIRTVIRSKV